MADGKTAVTIKNYVVANKLRNITGNDKLTSKEIKKMVEMLDEVSPRVFTRS